MKKTIAMIALAALFVSCAKEAEQTPATTGEVITVAPTEFHATLEPPEPDTRTTLGGENYTQVLWEKDDSISVWPGVFNQAKYTLSSGEGTTLATFTSSQTVEGAASDLNIALYPYDKDVVLTESGVLTNVKYPEVQDYMADSWDKVVMPMAAMSVDTDDHDFQFMNLAGVLRLTLTGTATIDSIRVSSLDKEVISQAVNSDPSTLGYKRISGTARVTISYPEHEGGENTVTVDFDSESSSNTVTLKCGETGVKLSETESTVFNIVIPRLDGGFKVAVFDSEHGVMILQSKSRIKRNTILDMPSVSYKPSAMDLGLSVYWATCNVGATTPEGYGDYFAWGETETKDTYTWDSYSLTSDGGSTFTKYNGTDGKTVLEPEDDAATQNCGSAWRMPTMAEFEELCNKNNCTWTWTTYNGVNGYSVVSKKAGYEDAYIFLPAAGCRYGDSLYYVGDRGYYWSSSLGHSSYASYLYFYDSYISTNNNGSRYFGRSVRPVTE